MANEMFSSLPDVMTAERLASALQISKSGAYALLNRSDFPTLRIGGRKMVMKKDLLEWLKNHKPAEDPVLSHGDFCLPNIFLDGDEVSGFIDLGRSGIADPYQDIALCYRSLCHNFDGTYGRAYPGFDPMMLFRELGIDPDWEKIRYYRLLDELF